MRPRPMRHPSPARPKSHYQETCLSKCHPTLPDVVLRNDDIFCSESRNEATGHQGQVISTFKASDLTITQSGFSKSRSPAATKLPALGGGENLNCAFAA